MRPFLFCFLIGLLSLSACVNDIEEINQVFNKSNLEIENLENVEILYSDSAKVHVRILGPEMQRYVERKEAREEFPAGLKVEFLNNNNQISSQLTADFAVRYNDEKKVITKGNVCLINSTGDKLESPELIWNEETGAISSEKAIRITRPTTGDTIMGFGILTDRDFKRFEIKDRVSARMNMKKFLEEK